MEAHQHAHPAHCTAADSASSLQLSPPAVGEAPSGTIPEVMLEGRREVAAMALGRTAKSAPPEAKVDEAARPVVPGVVALVARFVAEESPECSKVAGVARPVVLEVAMLLAHFVAQGFVECLKVAAVRAVEGVEWSWCCRHLPSARRTSAGADDCVANEAGCAGVP